jgi:hypothetical protein
MDKDVSKFSDEELINQQEETRKKIATLNSKQMAAKIL